MSDLPRNNKHHHQRNKKRVAIENVELLREDQNRQDPHSSEYQHRRHQTYPASQGSSKDALLTNQELSAAEAPFAAPQSNFWYNYGGYFYPPPPYSATGSSGGQQNQQQTPKNNVKGQQTSPSASHSKQAPPQYGSQYGAYYPYYFPGGYPPAPPPTSSGVNFTQPSQQYAPPWPSYPHPMMSYPQQQHRDQSLPLQQQQQPPPQEQQQLQHPLKRTSAEEAAPASRTVWSNPSGPEESVSLLQKTTTGYGSTATGGKNVSPPTKSLKSPPSAGTPSEPSNQPLPQDSMLSPGDRPAKTQARDLHHSQSSEEPLPLPPKHNRPPTHHRRVKSDIPQLEARQKPRQAGPIPPSDPIRTHKRFSPTDSRRKTWSGQQVEFSEPVRDSAPRSAGGGGVGSSSKHHRRVSSLTGTSLYTDTSILSVVTDIRKSSFFQGYDEEGRPEMNYPYAHVHLTMSKNLPRGELFKVPTNERRFEDYHLITESSEFDLYGFEDLDRGCNCSCDQCHACTGKQNLLPPNYYVLKVDDDLYRRMIDEICDSQEMPCGLFFCGHHEDVSYPSIFIPVAFLLLLMIAMGTTAYILRI